MFGANSNLETHNANGPSPVLDREPTVEPIGGVDTIKTLIERGDVERLQTIADTKTVEYKDRVLGMKEEMHPIEIDASWNYDQSGVSYKLNALKEYAAAHNNVRGDDEYYRFCISTIEGVLEARKYLESRQS